MKYLPIIIFLSFALGILFAGHYLLFKSLIKFFNINNDIKIYLAVLLGLLSMSFIFASLLVHYFETGLVKAIYFFAGLWLVLAFYLLLAVGSVWVTYLFSRITGASFDFRLVSSIYFVLAFALTAYGAWNATQIKVRKIDVKIKNLPVEWQNKAIIQITDVHLGSINGARFINDIVDQINAISPEAVMITGDYFDGMDGILTDLAEPLDRLQASKGVFFITGNHETYLGVEKSLQAFSGTKVKVLDDEKVDLEGLSLVGVSYPDRFENKDISAVIKDLNPARPTILLYHAPAQIQAIAKSHIDLMLSGHTHKGQFWPFNYVTQMIFGKYHYGMNEIGDFTIYTSPGTGTWGPALRIGNRPEITEIILRNK